MKRYRYDRESMTLAGVPPAAPQSPRAATNGGEAGEAVCYDCPPYHRVRLPKQGAVAQKQGAKPRSRGEATQMPAASEHQEQSLLFQWADAAKGRYPELGLLFAIPNFAGRLGRLTAIHGAKLKREGRKRGVPDVMLPVPRGRWHGLFVELKRVRGSSTTAEQRAWLAALTAQGYRAVRCLGWEEARAEIVAYLEAA